jgi:hypothetical protein
MRVVAWLLVSALGCQSASAGPIAERFGSDILGIPWNSSLDTVVGTLPVGDHVYATTPGQRAYLVRDDQDFMGVSRRGHNVLYGFGQKNELVAVVVSFPYERKEELIGALISAFGAPQGKMRRGQQQLTGWRNDRGVSVSLTTSSEAKHGIAWLSIRGPNYPREEANKAIEPTR